MGRLGELQAAIRAAFTGEDVVRVLRALQRRAERGDTNAAALFLTRLCGPPGRRVHLPELAEAKDTPARLKAVLAAVASGALTIEAGAALCEIVRPRDPLADEPEGEDSPDQFFA